MVTKETEYEETAMPLKLRPHPMAKSKSKLY